MLRQAWQVGVQRCKSFEAYDIISQILIRLKHVDLKDATWHFLIIFIHALSTIHTKIYDINTALFYYLNNALLYFINNEAVAGLCLHQTR